MKNSRSRRIARRSLPFAIGGALAIPVMAECYDDIYIGQACALQTSCDTSQACTQVDTVINEAVFTTVTDGTRTTSTPIGYVCYKTWTEFNEQAQCVVPKWCGPVVNGAQATGGICPGQKG